MCLDNCDCYILGLFTWSDCEGECECNVRTAKFNKNVGGPMSDVRGGGQLYSELQCIIGNVYIGTSTT